MTDIYKSSLAAKYESVMRVVATELDLGSDLTALTSFSLKIVHEAAEQAIMEWAIRRQETRGLSRPISNLQHLLDEYCAIADHL